MDSRRKNSTVILVCRSCLMNYYLEKGFVSIEYNAKQLSSVPNDTKLRINGINKQKKRLWYGVLHSNLLCSRHHKEIVHSV